MNGDERMVDYERMESEKTNDKVSESQELIIEIICKVNNIGTLEYLYTFIKLFLEKWG